MHSISERHDATRPAPICVNGDIAIESFSDMFPQFLKYIELYISQYTTFSGVTYIGRPKATTSAGTATTTTLRAGNIDVQVG